MRKLAFLFSILTLLLVQCNPVKTELNKKVTGAWLLEGMQINQSTSSPQQMGEPQYQFHENGEYYIFHAGQKEEGHWSVDSDSTLVLKSETYPDKGPQYFKITMATGEKLRYRAKSGKWRVEVQLIRF